jgi:hypothetical protein
VKYLPMLEADLLFWSFIATLSMSFESGCSNDTSLITQRCFNLSATKVDAQGQKLTISQHCSSPMLMCSQQYYHN